MVIDSLRNTSWLLLIAGSFGCSHPVIADHQVASEPPHLSTIEKLRPDGRYENLAIQAGVSGLTAAEVKGIYFYQPDYYNPEPPPATGPVTSKSEITKILNALRGSSREKGASELGWSKDQEMVYIIRNNGEGLLYYFDGYPMSYDSYLGPEVATLMKKYGGTSSEAMLRKMGARRFYQPQHENWFPK